MATQANYDDLATAVAAGDEDAILDSGGKLLEELRAGDPLPTGGQLTLPDDVNRGAVNLVRGVNFFL